MQEVFLSLNSLCSLATQEAASKSLPACIEFKKSKNNQWKAHAKILEKIDVEGKKHFKPIYNGFVQNKFTFPKNISLAKWWTDQKNDNDSVEKDAFVINISNQGFCQVAILHLIENSGGTEKKYSAKTNPFLAKFEKHSGLIEIPQKDQDE